MFPLRARSLRRAVPLLLAVLAACGTERTLEVTNLTPLPVDVAIRYTASPDSVATQGWFRLEPGEARTFKRKFRRVQPGFAVYGHTTGPPEFTRWVHGRPDDSPGRRYFAGDLPGPVTTAGFDIRTPTGETRVPATRTAGFAPVPPSGERGRAHRVVLKDQRFAAVYRAAVQAGGDDPVKAAAAQVAKLAGALRHQHWFFRTFKNPEREYPFALAGIEDGNGPYLAGVNVKLAPDRTIWGDPYPLQAGDQLLSLDAQDIYGAEDLLSVLWNHATDTLSGGIREPMAFTVLRGGKEVSGRTTYFFNDAHFERSPGEARRAAWVGGLNSFTFGLGCQLTSPFGRREFSRKRRAWNCHQEKARLQQQYRKNYAVGEAVSILIPIGGPIAAMKGVRGARGARTARAFTVSRVGHSMAIATFSALNRRSPLDGPGDVMADAGKDMLMQMGVEELFAIDLMGGG